MQRLEVSGAVRPIYGSLGFKRLNCSAIFIVCMFVTVMAAGGLAQLRRPQDAHTFLKLIWQRIFSIYTMSISYAIMLIIIIYIYIFLDTNWKW